MYNNTRHDVICDSYIMCGILDKSVKVFQTEAWHVWTARIKKAEGNWLAITELLTRHDIVTDNMLSWGRLL